MRLVPAPHKVEEFAFGGVRWQNSGIPSLLLNDNATFGGRIQYMYILPADEKPKIELSGYSWLGRVKD